MNGFRDRRVIAVLGCAAALGLALLVGLAVMRGRGPDAPQPQVGSGLQIEQGLADAKASPTKPLRCFVDGKFVGMAPVAECAQKNGVAAQALDVGLDPATGEVQAGASLAPPPVAATPPPAAAAPAQTAEAASAPSAEAPAECLRYTADGWRPASGSSSLRQCARLLFDGRCSRPGEALYGRWGGDTLRLVQSRVEMSGDNRTFHPLSAQNPEDCTLPDD
jgi:hypothetical protein